MPWRSRELQWEIVDRCLQLHGGYETPVSAADLLNSPGSHGNVAAGCREPERGFVPGVNTATMGRTALRRT
jgi:hypothetical protein